MEESREAKPPPEDRLHRPADRVSARVAEDGRSTGINLCGLLRGVHGAGYLRCVPSFVTFWTEVDDSERRS